MKSVLAAITLTLVAVPLWACSKTSSASEAAQQAPPMEPMAQDHNAAQAAATRTDPQIASVTVNENGFTPDHVEFKHGTKATLRFTRTSDKTCATAVAIPELNLNKALPINQAVDIELPTDQPRTLTFQCGMGMYKSKILVL